MSERAHSTTSGSITRPGCSRLWSSGQLLFSLLATSLAICDTSKRVRQPRTVIVPRTCAEYLGFALQAAKGQIG